VSLGAVLPALVVPAARVGPRPHRGVRVTGTLGPGIEIAGNQGGLLIVEQRRT
jgi:hypothetical protein